jgi:hypothetical protein
VAVTTLPSPVIACAAGVSYLDMTGGFRRLDGGGPRSCKVRREFKFKNRGAGVGALCPFHEIVEEIDMFLHLPIAMMAMLSPIAVSDTMPAFNIVQECRFEGGSTGVFDHCSKDETDARRQLQAEWGQFVAGDKSTCIVETTIGGFASYVELLTCLEMANDVRNEGRQSRGSLANEGAQSMGQDLPEMRVGDGPDPNSVAVRRN